MKRFDQAVAMLVSGMEADGWRHVVFHSDLKAWFYRFERRSACPCAAEEWIYLEVSMLPVEIETICDPMVIVIGKIEHARRIHRAVDAEHIAEAAARAA